MQRNIIYDIARVFVQAYSRLMLRMDIHIHAVLPESPKLFIANYPSATDPILIHLLERMSVLITANAFAFPILGAFLRRIEQSTVCTARYKWNYQSAKLISTKTIAFKGISCYSKSGHLKKLEMKGGD